MHSSSELDLPGLDEKRTSVLLERTIDRSRGLRRRRRRFTLVAGAVTLALIAGLVSAPRSTSPRPVAATTWRLLADVSAQFSAQDVSFTGVTLVCPSVTTCYADGDVGGNLVVEVTQDAGAQWSRLTPPGEVNPTSITCVDAETCATLTSTASGAAFTETTDGGTSWSSSPFPATPTGLATLSCTSVQDCVAVSESTGGTALSLVTSDSGQTWASTDLPIQSMSTSGLEVTGLACFPGGDCTILGSVPAGVHQPATVVVRSHAHAKEIRSATSTWHPFSLRSTDGGSTWSIGVVPASFVPGYDFSCSSGADCLAVGNTTSSAPLVLSTDNGGASWSEVSVPSPLTPSGNVFINWVSCTVSACWMSGGSFGQRSGSSHGFLDESTDLGATWTPTSLPPSVDALGNVACTAGSTCFALGAESNGSGPSTLVLLSNAP